MKPLVDLKPCEGQKVTVLIIKSEPVTRRNQGLNVVKAFNAIMRLQLRRDRSVAEVMLGQLALRPPDSDGSMEIRDSIFAYVFQNETAARQWLAQQNQQLSDEVSSLISSIQRSLR